MFCFFAHGLFRLDGRFRLRLGLGALPLFVVLLACSGCSHVQHPDFSGRWELDVGQSDFGPVPGPSQSTQVIEHQEPVLRLTADSVGFMGEDHAEFEFHTDGSEAIQTVEGRARKTQSYWEDAVLITKWEVENPGQPRFEMLDRRSLSEDGQTMVVNRLVVSNWDQWEQKAVFTRKPSG
jgi:hypothetical protein